MLFRSIRESLGFSTLQVEVCQGTTAGELKDRLAVDYPEIAQLILSSRLAVSHRFLPDEEVIPLNSTGTPRGPEVALIPPVSGG